MTQELNLTCDTDPGGSFQGPSASTWFTWTLTNKFLHCNPPRILTVNRRLWGVTSKTQDIDCSFTFYVRVNSTPDNISVVNIGFCNSIDVLQEKNFVGVQVYYRDHDLPYSPASPFSISSVIYDSLGQLDAGSVGPLDASYLNQWLRVECSYISKKLVTRVYDNNGNLLSDVTIQLTVGRTLSTNIFTLACSTVDDQNMFMNMDAKNITADRYANTVEIKNTVLRNTVAKAGV